MNNFNFPFNPHAPEYKILIQLFTYLVENLNWRVEKQKLYYIMFLTDYISLMHQAKFLSKDNYYFDYTYWEWDIIDIFMVNWEAILNATIPNGYIVEGDDGYVNLLQTHLKEFISEDYEKIYLNEAIAVFWEYTVDQLADICYPFFNWEIWLPLTQESLIYNENIHPVLQPYIEHIEYIKREHAMMNNYTYNIN